MSKRRRLVPGLAASLLMVVSWALNGYAVLLVFFQCLTWLKTGSWQPVPVYTLFVDLGRLPPGDITPLALVPSLADYNDPPSVARVVSGSAAGIEKLVTWLLETALSVWVFALAIGVFALAGREFNARSPRSRKKTVGH